LVGGHDAEALTPWYAKNSFSLYEISTAEDAAALPFPREIVLPVRRIFVNIAATTIFG
jgi:hypothetical protein